MKALGLKAKAGRKCKATTDSKHTLPLAPNLLVQDFKTSTTAHGCLTFHSDKGSQYTSVELRVHLQNHGY